MLHRLLSFFLGLSLLTACGTPVSEEVSSSFPEEKLGTVEEDVAYCSGNENQVMDFYYPGADSLNSEEPYPVVLYVHGGGWSTGDKSDLALYREALVSKGIAVAALNYSLAPDSVFPTNIEDLKCAVRSLRAHANDYHIDPDRIGGYGGSAGAHLVSLLGTTGDETLWDTDEYSDYSSALVAVVDLYGPTDLTVEFPGNELELLKNAFGDDSYQDAADQSPVTYIDSKDPSFLIMHGEEDSLVPISQSEGFYELLTEAGVEATFIPVADAGHGFMMAHKGVVPDPSPEEIAEIMSDWLVEELGAEVPEINSSEEAAPFYITTMTHMEGNFKDNEIEKLFLKHVEQIRYAMDLFDEYGAKLTLESEQSFALANTAWNLNILKEVVERGHGVGTHADFGANLKDPLTQEEQVLAFEKNKALVDDLVGAENNRGVSGGTGYNDWVLAASEAGFDFMDAVTGFGYLAMDEDERPEGWTDEYIREVTYHDPIPVDLEDRLYPLSLEDATDLEADEDGVITLMGGDIGEFSSLAEGRNECFPDCELTEDDVTAYFEQLDEALALRDPTKVARINIHIPLVLFDPANETVFRSFLERLQGYIEEGQVQWATQLESYDGYSHSRE